MCIYAESAVILSKNGGERDGIREVEYKRGCSERRDEQQRRRECSLVCEGEGR